MSHLLERHSLGVPIRTKNFVESEAHGTTLSLEYLHALGKVLSQLCHDLTRREFSLIDTSERAGS